MSLEGVEAVVADKAKFAFNLGIPESMLDEILKALPLSSLGALLGGWIGWLMTASPIVLKIGGSTLIGASGPVGWIVGGIAGLATGGGLHYAIKMYKDHLDDTGKVKKEFSGKLSVIGKVVADVVFVPAVYLVMMDWSDKKGDFILSRLKKWGYDDEWSKRFLEELRGSGDDILDRTIQTLKRWDKHGIKDKAVTKPHLIHCAEILLNEVKLEFSWDQITAEKRKSAIVIRMKEGV